MSTADQQARVCAFARASNQRLPRGGSLQDLMSLARTLDPTSAEEMRTAVDEEFEQLGAGDQPMRGTDLVFRIEIEPEEDGRYLAEVMELPGVLVYGEDTDDALARVQALALRVLADRIENERSANGIVNLRFAVACLERLPVDQLEVGTVSSSPTDIKEEARRMLDRLPDLRSWEALQYHIHVRQKIDAGRRAVAEGRVVSQEEVDRQFAELRRNWSQPRSD